MAAERAARILMTADTVGGVWTYAVELARELAARGVQVALATMGAPLSPHRRQALADHPEISLCESHWRLEWMQDCRDDVDAAGRWLLELERAFAPDLVHLNQFSFGALPFRAPKLVVAHSCVLSWWRAVHGEAAPPEWDGYRARVRQGLAGAGLVVAPTQAMLASLAQDHGHAGPGLVIPNGARAAAIHNRVPPPVTMLLLMCVTFSMFLTGHSSGMAGHRQWLLWCVMIILMVAVFTLAEDLDRPRRGLIQLNHAPLIELRASMGQ